MRTKKIGLVQLNHSALAKDVDTILGFEMSKSYAEYAVGVWETCWLWNRTGQKSQALSEEYDGTAKITELGEQLPYLNLLIKKTFKTDLLKSVRIFAASGGGFIRTHRDYKEFATGFTRIHVPLQTDEKCLNSEGNTVYRMKQGEVWFLDGHNPHSGGCFSANKRLHLVLDFASGLALEDIFEDSGCYMPDGKEEHIPRPPLTSDEMEAILGLSNIMTEMNRMDIAGLLNKVHFERDTNCAEIYDWMIEIAERTKNPTMVDRSKEMKEYFLGAS